ncbi:hypothetical protein [Pseudoalteromonas luteoviolacea]|uniref:Uncharacterized protein n=1 Tax=Pseudoalteromonas luteoviolacea NCIMB 1942 TaxID=1365253 RepID=A0A167DRD2_9GAMM|nr:hypothetical protein [Pseudoalteromonas luteoviolacea]KZN49236.1 hypothetical protein N482_06775 [Pseudoalteromonas luteoviolacea NCIMB 1942]
MLHRCALFFVFIIVAVPSSSHYTQNFKNLNDAQVEILIAHTSQNLNISSPIYLELSKRSHRMSDKQVQQLRKQGFSHFSFEWAIRLTEQRKHRQARLLFERFWRGVDESMQIRLLALLQQQKRYHAMAEIFKAQPKIEPYYTMSQLAQGKGVDGLNQDALFQLGITTLSMLKENPQQCAHHILLLSDTLESTLKLDELKRAYEQSELGKRLPYCLSKPVYVGDLLHCQGGSGQFIQCSLANVLDTTALAQARHLVVMSELSGFANVRHGVMALNHNNGLELFVHELMHFTHFEDEYPVPINKAKWLCASSGLKAPNLYVGEHPPKNWYVSKTCLHGKLTSYKPSKVQSKMEYHAIDLSNQYLGLWLKALEHSLLEPSDYQVYYHKLVNRDLALVK